MPRDDRTYFQERASTERKLAKQAKNEAATKAHEALAAAYAEHIHPLKQAGVGRL